MIVFDAVKKKHHCKTTTTRINNNDSSMQQYNITPFEDGNNYEINLNNIELYEFDNFNNQLEENTEHKHVETIECEEKGLQSIDEEMLNTPSTIISSITENQNIEVVEYEEDIHNNL